MTSTRPLGSYGVDAPWVPWMWIGYAILYACLATASVVFWSAWWPVTALLSVIALASVIGAALFWYASLRGKFILWERILQSAKVGNRRNALDLGCGHGMVAIMTALQAPAMTVVGIDLWRSVDQSGNTPEAARANARMNGVDNRVRFDTGDMTALPYESRSFDLVTASLAIHNIPTREERRAAINEAVRVLSDGGVILIADIRRTNEYAQHLRAAGLHVTTQPLGWRGWWSGPWMATTSLSATKAHASNGAQSTGINPPE